ncbi:MAG: twin-arginine translocase TatA/TatE family subunit [Elusimicrobia bacterium]|nr:twin-arginine translocase TatA/TatE family subunit [Elusimicrobiota bacterium]
MRILGMGLPELLVIGLVCVLLFGAKKLPELGKSLGLTIKELKKSLKEGLSEEDSSDEGKIKK